MGGSAPRTGEGWSAFPQREATRGLGSCLVAGAIRDSLAIRDGLEVPDFLLLALVETVLRFEFDRGRGSRPGGTEKKRKKSQHRWGWGVRDPGCEGDILRTSGGPHSIALPGLTMAWCTSPLSRFARRRRHGSSTTVGYRTLMASPEMSWKYRAKIGEGRGGRPAGAARAPEHLFGAARPPATGCKGCPGGARDIGNREP